MPHCLDGHDLALQPNSALEAAPVSAPTLNPEPDSPIEDGWLDIASGAAISTAIEPNTNPVLCEARDSKVPDSSPDSEPSAPLPIKSDWAPIMEFHRRGYLSALALRRHTEFTKVSLLVRRVLAGL